jgi:hypothetical protein
MRMALWVLGAEVFAIDVGRSPEPEQEQMPAAGGQFELGFQGSDVDASMDQVAFDLKRVKRPRREP